MTLRTTETGEITKPAVKDLATVAENYLPAIQRALPSHLRSPRNAERMLRIYTTALSANPDLQKCTPRSWVISLLHMAQLGLEPNTPFQHAALVPIWNKRKSVYECHPWLMYQGMIELALRSGYVKFIRARVVKEGDVFEWEEGMEQLVRHVVSGDDNREERKTTHAYAVATLQDGSKIAYVCTRAEIERARKASRSGEIGPWTTHFDEMAMKTPVRRLFKYLQKSAEMSRAMAMEEASEVEGEPSASVIEVLEDPMTSVQLDKAGLFSESAEGSSETE